MISDNFNRKAMAEKVRVNRAKGLSIKQIKILLREEFIQNRKSVMLLEARAVELMDQIEYMDEVHKEDK